MEMKPIQSRRVAVPLGRASRLVLASTVGHDNLDARLSALAPLRHAMVQASVALFDDGTLSGADRVRLARACADPLIMTARKRDDGFPDAPDWAILLTALEQRRNAYWVLLGGTVAEEAVPDLARAIASNRCFAIVGDEKGRAELVPHFDALASDGFPHLNPAASLLGFAACGDGLALANAVLTRLETLLRERARRPDMARIVAGFILARERDAVLLRNNPGSVHSPGSISLL